jgi:hypothetical protein
MPNETNTEYAAQMEAQAAHLAQINAEQQKVNQ